MFNRNHHVMDSSQSRSLLQKVYSWMALALGITSITAYTVANSSAIYYLMAHPMLFWGLAFAQIGLVISLSARIQRMSTETAMTVFLAYSALTGVTMSTIILAYTAQSIAATFLITAGMFISMAVYGSVTKSDLSSMGSFLTMGLFGLIIANIVGMFIGGANFNLVTAAFGVMIFTLFTAYDVHMIKRMGSQMLMSEDDMFKVSLIGALKLYLDFINLFLYLLRFFGNQRRN